MIYRRTERQVLERYAQTTIPDVPTFPPNFPVYSQTEFMREVFWPAMLKRGALACGLNLPFDITRLALDWNKGAKNEWSLTMTQYADGADNKNYPALSYCWSSLIDQVPVVVDQLNRTDRKLL